MENAEEIMHSLEEFAKLKPKDIPRELDDYLGYVAKTGDPVFKWSIIKCLFREKLVNVITDFYESTLTIELPPCPNVDVFNYERMKASLLERIDSFHGAPFTVQRISELLTNPRKEYNRADKFMRAIEKNILVVSTREPGRYAEVECDNQPDASYNGMPYGRDPLYDSLCNDLADPDSSSQTYEVNSEPSETSYNVVNVNLTANVTQVQTSVEEKTAKEEGQTCNTTQPESESSTQLESESTTQLESESSTQIESGSSTQIESESSTQIESESSTQIESESSTQIESESSAQLPPKESEPANEEIVKTEVLEETVICSTISHQDTEEQQTVVKQIEESTDCKTAEPSTNNTETLPTSQLYDNKPIETPPKPSEDITDQISTSTVDNKENECVVSEEPSTDVEMTMAKPVEKVEENEVSSEANPPPPGAEESLPQDNSEPAPAEPEADTMETQSSEPTEPIVTPPDTQTDEVIADQPREQPTPVECATSGSTDTEQPNTNNAEVIQEQEKPIVESNDPVDTPPPTKTPPAIETPLAMDSPDLSVENNQVSSHNTEPVETSLPHPVEETRNEPVRESTVIHTTSEPESMEVDETPSTASEKSA